MSKHRPLCPCCEEREAEYRVLLPLPGPTQGSFFWVLCCEDCSWDTEFEGYHVETTPAFRLFGVLSVLSFVPLP